MPRVRVTDDMEAFIVEEYRRLRSARKVSERVTERFGASPCDEVLREIAIAGGVDISRGVRRRIPSKVSTWFHKRTGYILEYVGRANPHARTNGMVFQHIRVAEETIGRRLKRGEQTHHVNGIKTDNRPENLRVLTASEHKRLHEELGRVEEDIRTEYERRAGSALPSDAPLSFLLPFLHAVLLDPLVDSWREAANDAPLDVPA